MPPPVRRAIVLGQGRTGSHSIYYALCLLSVPTAHYRMTCNIGTPWRCPTSHAEASRSCAGSSTPLEPAEQSKSHAAVLTLYEQAKLGSVERVVSGGEWAAEMAAAMKRVFRERLSVADAPYTLMPSLLLAPPWKNTTLFLDSERPAADWAHSRLRNAGKGTDVMCTLPSRGQQRDDPLDIYACARRCASRPLDSCLVSYEKVGERRLADAYAAHRRRLAESLPPRLVVSFQLFTKQSMGLDPLRREIAAAFRRGVPLDNEGRGASPGPPLRLCAAFYQLVQMGQLSRTPRRMEISAKPRAKGLCLCSESKVPNRSAATPVLRQRWRPGTCRSAAEWKNTCGCVDSRAPATRSVQLE